MVTQETHDAIDWYMRFEDAKVMPVGGGWLDQTAVYTETMDVIRAAVSLARSKR